MADAAYKQLVESQIVAAGSLYACPTGKVASIQAAMLCNTTAGTIAATVYITGAAGTLNDAATFIKAVDVLSHDTYLCPELIGQKVTALHQIHVAGAGLTFAVGGIEATLPV